jgi:hypothetical protein
MTASFALCRECLAKYLALTHDSTSRFLCNTIPFCSLVWPDEHPERLADIFSGLEHKTCKASIIRLVSARTELWRTGVIPEDLHGLWAEAHRVIPNWPGFKRLSLNEYELKVLEECAEELGDLVAEVKQDFPYVTITNSDGVTHFSAQRTPPMAIQAAPPLCGGGTPSSG